MKANKGKGHICDNEADTADDIIIENDKLAKRLRDKLHRSRADLISRYQLALTQLDISAETQLKHKDALTIMQLLGLELNEYQKAELDNTMDRAHEFNPFKLRGWILKNHNFLLHVATSNAIGVAITLERGIRGSHWIEARL